MRLLIRFEQGYFRQVYLPEENRFLRWEGEESFAVSPADFWSWLAQKIKVPATEWQIELASDDPQLICPQELNAQIYFVPPDQKSQAPSEESPTQQNLQRADWIQILVAKTQRLRQQLD